MERVTPRESSKGHRLTSVAQCRDPRMLGHRFSDRGVQAAVQRIELFHGGRRLLFKREPGNRPTNVAVVMDHL